MERTRMNIHLSIRRWRAPTLGWICMYSCLHRIQQILLRPLSIEKPTCRLVILFFSPPSPTSREANSFDSILQSLWSIIPSIILYKLLAARYTYIEYKSSIKKKSYTSVLKWFFFFSILRFLERINFVCVVDRIRHLSHRKSNPPLWWISLSALWPLLLIVPVLFCVYR